MKLKLIKFSIWLLLSCSSLSFTSAQDLPRRAFLGIQMDTLSPKLRAQNSLTADKGVLIINVFDQSTAAKAGFLKDDILLKFENIDITSPSQLVSLMKEYPSGADVEYTLLRDNKVIKKKTIVSPLPEESYTGLKTVYSSVKSISGNHRTILTAPLSEGRHPAILFIQGIGCYSIDSPFDTLRSENQLLSKLTRAGFVTLRIEKSGVGDSKGIPCEEIDFKEELAAFKEALYYLQNQKNVDKNKIFIIGHSMGGLMAPILANEQQIQGIIAYGTLGVNFLEYYVNSRRSISEARQMGPSEADDFIKLEGLCIAQFIELLNNNVGKSNIQCEAIVEALGFRSKNYWRQLLELNIASLWVKYNGNVLAARGASDYISNQEEHEHIAKVVTESGGIGNSISIKNADHGMNYAENYQQAMMNPGHFNDEVYITFLAWLKEVMNKS